MLKSDVKTLIEKIKIKILYWKMVTSDEFNFFKVKNIVKFNTNYYF